MTSGALPYLPHARLALALQCSSMQLLFLFGAAFCNSRKRSAQVKSAPLLLRAPAFNRHRRTQLVLKLVYGSLSFAPPPTP